MGRLRGRFTVVTGAASGLRLATSKRFAAEGARVVMVDLNEDEVRRVAESAGQAAVACDVLYLGEINDS